MIFKFVLKLKVRKNKMAALRRRSIKGILRQSIELDYAVEILFMFLVSYNSAKCLILIVQTEPDYFSFQPRFGYIGLNEINSRCLRHGKSLFIVLFDKSRWSLCVNNT